MSGDLATQAAASSSAKGPIRLMAASYAGPHRIGTRSRKWVKRAGSSTGCGKFCPLVVPVPLHQNPVRDAFECRLDRGAVGTPLERRRGGQLLDDPVDQRRGHRVDLLGARLGQPQQITRAQRVSSVDK